MVAPNPSRIRNDAVTAHLELRRQVREIVGNAAAAVWRVPLDLPVPMVQVIVAAGRPFRVTVEFIDCDAAVGGLMPVVTVQEVSSRQSLARWIRNQFGFTAREARVALCLARRRSNAEIARALHISPHTARRHTENVMTKMNLRSRFAVQQAIQAAISSLERRRKDGQRGRHRTGRAA